MNKKSYFEVAKNDYAYLQFAKEHMENEVIYNNVSVQAQQVVEKLFKYVIDEFCLEDDNSDLLRSHKLYILQREMKNQAGITAVSDDDARFLTSFYFDARYPGEDYITVSKEEAERALRIADEAYEAVSAFREEKSKEEKAAEADSHDEIFLK